MEKEKVTILSETKKKQLLRVGKGFDEAGIKTVKQARELLVYIEDLESNINKENKSDELTIEESKDDVLEKIEGVIENQKKVKESKEFKNDKVDDVKVFKAKSEKKVNSEEKIIPRQTRKDRSKEGKKKINNAKGKEETRNRLFG